jgi:hypothetical protein
MKRQFLNKKTFDHSCEEFLVTHLIGDQKRSKKKFLKKMSTHFKSDDKYVLELFHDLYLCLDNKKSLVAQDMKQIENVIHLAINRKKVVEIQFLKGQKIYCFPYEIFKFEQKMYCIVEESMDKALNYFDMKNILSVTAYDEDDYQPNFTIHHIHEFLNGLKSLGEEETRIVIKFHSLEKVTFYDVGRFVLHPYLTINGQGEFLWAASVTHLDHVFEWLFQIGHSAEVIDPSEVKERFLRFCQNKLMSEDPSR